MPGRIPAENKRKFARARVSLFADCVARVDTPALGVAEIEDLSVGGIRLHFINLNPLPNFAVGASIRGEVASENPALEMRFSGKIVWISHEQGAGSPGLRVGILFDDDVVRSEVVLSLQPAGER